VRVGERAQSPTIGRDDGEGSKLTELVGGAGFRPMEAYEAEAAAVEQT
jgi:hypothetical protein